MQPADKDQFRGVYRGSFAQLYVVQITGWGFAMRLRGIKGSRNIEDRRGGGGKRRAAGGIGGVGLLVVLVVGYFTGVDVASPLDAAQQPQQTQSRQVSAQDERAGQFTSAVLATTEQVWTKIFREQLDLPYNAPVLVLYSGVTQSPCGGASGATGSFYCPADKKAYLAPHSSRRCLSNWVQAVILQRLM